MVIGWALVGCGPQVPTDAPSTPSGPIATQIPQDTQDTAQPVEPPRTWVAITSSPCAVDTVGVITCWSSSAWPIPENGWLYQAPVPPFTTRVGQLFARDTDSIWGTGVDGGAVRLLCGPEEVGPPDDEPIAGWCTVPSGTLFTAISGTAGLTPTGEILTWPERETFVLDWAGSSRFVLLHPSMYGEVVALDEANVGYRGPARRPDWAWSHAFPTDRQITAITPGGPRALCVLDTNGDIECVGEPDHPHAQPAVFAHPPYIRLDGYQQVVCAQRADHVIECNDGSVHDFGPLVDLQVYSHQILVDRDEVGEAQMCVLTVENDIHCVGSRYPQDLQDQLDAVNAE